MVNFSDYVKGKLNQIKKDENHMSFDSVERMLLYRAGFIPVTEPELLTPRPIYDCGKCERGIECLHDPVYKAVCHEMGTRIFEMTKRLDPKSDDASLVKILDGMRDYGVLDVIVAQRHIQEDTEQ
jgi:hypothetical protein